MATRTPNGHNVIQIPVTVEIADAVAIGFTPAAQTAFRHELQVIRSGK